MDLSYCFFLCFVIKTVFYSQNQKLKITIVVELATYSITPNFRKKSLLIAVSFSSIINFLLLRRSFGDSHILFQRRPSKTSVSIEPSKIWLFQERILQNYLLYTPFSNFFMGVDGFYIVLLRAALFSAFFIKLLGFFQSSSSRFFFKPFADPTVEYGNICTVMRNTFMNRDRPLCTLQISAEF